MSANFYNKSGDMVGIDIHRYWTLPGAPIPTWPHVVYAPFSWKLSDSAKRLGAVTSNREPMAQEGMDLSLVPHIPVPYPPPNPGLEALELAAIIAGSSSKAVLAVASVTGQGKPLAVCIHAGFGLNANCHEGWKLPTGVVIQSNTVMTEPTAGDYASAVVDVALDTVISKVSGPIAGKIADKLGLKALKNIIKEQVKDRLKEFKKEHEKTIKKVIHDLL